MLSLKAAFFLAVTSVKFWGIACSASQISFHAAVVRWLFTDIESRIPAQGHITQLYVSDCAAFNEGEPAGVLLFRRDVNPQTIVHLQWKKDTGDLSKQRLAHWCHHVPYRWAGWLFPIVVCHSARLASYLWALFRGVTEGLCCCPMGVTMKLVQDLQR